MSETNIETTPEVTPQTPAVEPVIQPAPPPPKQNKYSSNIKAIMDREAAIREREAQLRQTERMTEEVTRLKDLAKTNPVQFLEEHGVTLDRLEQIKTEASDPTRVLRRELEEIKNTIKIQNDSVHQQRQMAELSQAREQVAQWINANEKYPYVKAAGAQDLVVQRMLDHWNQTGEELSEEDAASDVDGMIKELAEKLVPLVGKPSNEFQDVTEQTTLTNQHAASKGNSGKRKLSRDESLEAAARLLRFTGE
jgi:hypothetical protein